MKVNIKKVKELIEENFEGKMSLLAKELEIDYSYINSIMNYKRSAGSKKMCDKLIIYCKENGLDYNKYIFF